MRSSMTRMLLAGILILTFAGNARASLIIQIFQVGNPPYEITGGADTLNIDVSDPLLLAAAPDFSFTSFGASSFTGSDVSGFLTNR